MALLERDPQLRAAADWLAEAAAGHGRLIFVAGEAGVGKTAFARAVTAGADVPVAWGSCDGASTPAALGPLVEMAPDLPAGFWPPDAPRAEVFARLVAALREVPYVLVIEDAHWADESTVDLILHLSRRIHTCRALVLVTYRPEDVDALHPLRRALGDAATAAGSRRLDLAPLTPDGVRALAGPGVDGDDLHRRTRGNPFFVSEVLAAGAATVPPTVRDAVLARTARLSGPARRALDVVALAGARAEVALLDEVLGDGLPDLDEPIERGMLVLSGGELTFRHELARVAVADQVPALRRIAVHRTILAALARSGADPARLAHHADAAADADAAVAFGTAAARGAARLGAHREAVAQYRRVLRNAGRLPAVERAGLLGELAYECYLTDLVDDALAARREALAIWTAAGDRARVGDTHRWLSRLSWVAADGSRAEQHARAAVEALDGADSIALATALSNTAQLRMHRSDLTGAREWGRRALDVLGRLPAGPDREEVEVHAVVNLGAAEAMSGDAAAGRRMLADGLAAALAGDLPEHVARTYGNIGSVAVRQHRAADAADALAAGLTYCLERDLDAWTLYVRGWQAQLALDRGELAGAQAAAVRTLDHPGAAPVTRIVPLIVLARVRMRAGRADWTEALDEAAELADRTGEPQRMAPVTSARCEAAWLAGEPPVPDAWARVASSDSPWDRGLVATWLGHPEPGLAPPYALEVAGRWAEAAALWRGLGRPYEEALALARSGEEPALRRAVAAFEAIGATAAADRARILLRTGGWRPPPKARPATRTHPAGLTPRQAEVHDLLTQGLSDAAIAERLVLSPRTVEHHVAAVLAKLGVGSRRQAAAWVPRTPG